MSETLTGPTQAVDDGKEQLRTGVVLHVWLGSPLLRFTGGEQASVKALAHYALELGSVELERKVNHRSQRRRTAKSTDGRDVGLGDVVVRDEHLHAAHRNSLGQTSIGIEVHVFI